MITKKFSLFGGVDLVVKPVPVFEYKVRTLLMGGNHSTYLTTSDKDVAKKTLDDLRNLNKEAWVETDIAT